MNAALSAGMISGFRSQTVTIESVQLHYRIGGDPSGQPVILWPRGSVRRYHQADPGDGGPDMFLT